MLQFVREVPIRIVIQGALSSRRGFLFHLAAGFSHDIDPLSGMSVNLMFVDEWLWKLKKDLEKDPFISSRESFNHAFAEVMAVTRLNLTQNAAELGVTLSSLTFREERGWSFSWNSAQAPEEMTFQYKHYIESMPKEGACDLVRVAFDWERVQGCEADYQHEGFLLLKPIANKDSEVLREELAKVVGHVLPSGSTLKNVQIEYLGENYRLTLP
nr:hypothetical protein [uncultured Bdellovibrio sp.]